MRFSLLLLLSLLITPQLGLGKDGVKSSGNDGANDCPNWLNHSFRQLHSTNEINLCERFSGRPLLLVNTASHCGFTHQFSGLEALHQRYKDRGFAVIGFASNDFRQAAKSEAEAASICYENYGVTFTMMAPIHVTGEQAHPLFKALANKSQTPSWNFNKFLVSEDGQSVTHFGSSSAPNSASFINALNALL
ncbi:MAG: glutathione peroxidase [Pseudomonadota bacterium]